jgi:hypothetical protein
MEIGAEVIVPGIKANTGGRRGIRRLVLRIRTKRCQGNRNSDPATKSISRLNPFSAGGVPLYPRWDYTP